MRMKLFGSFRSRLILNMLIALFMLIFSATYIWVSTVRIQETIGASYEQQRSIRQLGEHLDEFKSQFLEYLSSKSSNALSRLLILSQRIRSEIQRPQTIPLDATALREREVYAAITAYMDMADLAIEEKRGMDIASYTSLYAEMETMLSYITDEIDSISRSRYADLFATHERFAAVSRDIHLKNLLFMVGISLFTLIFVLSAVDRMNRPMVMLSSSAAEISNGNFNIEDIQKTGLSEVDQVVVAFNRMKKDVHTLIEELRWQRNVEKEYMNERMRNIRMEQTMRRMELYTLQAQMNPHFLFNTLNTGVQLAIMEGADKTSEYMEHLAKLMRHNLRKKEAFVPLRHEITGLESYFYILGVRFSKTLDLSLDCPLDILDTCSVPVSILQPLVENSVVHAFKGRTGPNAIAVTIWKEGDILHLSVRDNGRGMDEKTIAELLGPGEEMEESSGKVMGLENVIHRLRFFYLDSPDIIAINSGMGTGTEVLISIDTRRDPCLPF